MRSEAYSDLTTYLERSGKSELVMTFDEVKKANSGYSPVSAYKHRPWWAKDPRGHSHSCAWRNAGYKTFDVSLADQIVHFVMQ